MHTVSVGLGARSYEILIGHGLLDRAGAELARRLPGHALPWSRTAMSPASSSRRLSDGLAAAGLSATPIVVAARRKDKELRTA